LKVSRADFLKSCGIALLGHGTYLRVFPEMQAATIRDVTLPLETLTADSFHPHIDTEFTFRTAEHIRGRLVLTKVTERPISGNVSQFSLIFQSAEKMGFGGGNLVLHHRTLGSLELFMAPIGAPDSGGQKYQACFSRFVNSQGPGSGCAREGSDHVSE